MTQTTKSWDAAEYDQRHSFVWKFGADLIELLDPKPGERILDLGCGTGHLTRQIADRGADVLGIDSSCDMIDKAREAYPNLKFEIADARQFFADMPFDAIFSNAALHWIKPPERVIERMAENLKPGGRLVAEFGGKGNIATIERAIDLALADLSLPPRDATDYNFFPGVGQYSSMLEARGLEVTLATLFDRPTPLDEASAGLRNWLGTFRNNVLQRVPAKQREEFFAGIERRCSTLKRGDSWIADYRRIRIIARKSLDESYACFAQTSC